jgi:MFS family permease
VASLGGVLFGYDLGIVSGAMLQLKEEFGLDCQQQEMVVSSMLFGALIGSLTGGKKMQRKTTNERNFYPNEKKPCLNSI